MVKRKVQDIEGCEIPPVHQYFNLYIYLVTQKRYGTISSIGY